MNSRFFYAEKVENICSKLFVLSTDGRFYSEYLTSKHKIKFVDEIQDFKTFDASTYKWGSLQPIEEISENEARNKILIDQKNWIGGYLNGEIHIYEQKLKMGIKNKISKIAILICNPKSEYKIEKLNYALRKYSPEEEEKLVNKKKVLDTKHKHEFIDIYLGNTWFRIIVDEIINEIDKKDLDENVELISKDQLRLKKGENTKITILACKSGSKNQTFKMNSAVKKYISTENYSQFIQSRLDLRWCRVILEGINDFNFENLKDFNFEKFIDQKF
tara:strand:+ start:1556 stop:2377 length:822 start_codon:yes stop_codon:yes gene_type:complete